MALRDALEDAGYHVLDLTDRHQEAVKVARERKPALALVNIRLAGGDSGIALAEQLKKLDIPVLFISGQVSRAKTADTVAIGSMPKPYSAEDMVMAVDYLVAHLEGDNSLPRPPTLEVFEAGRKGLAPAA